MGHRLSKSNSTSGSSTGPNHRHSNDTLRLRNEVNLNSNPAGPPDQHSPPVDVRRRSAPASSTSATNQNQNIHIESTTLTVPAQAAARRFVIKIQLTKMEPDSSPCDTPTTTLSTSVALDGENGNSADNLDNNLNVTTPIFNLTFTKNIQCDSNDQIVIESNEEITLNNLSATSDHRTGSCVVNSNFISNFNPVHVIDEDGNELRNNISSLSLRAVNPAREAPFNSTCGNTMREVPENVNQQRTQNCSSTIPQATMCACSPEGDKDHCCRRKKSSSAYPSKWRCCKCICRAIAGQESKDTSNPEDSTSSSASSTSSKASSKTSWTSKLNCTRAENASSENSDLAMWMPPENSAFLSLNPNGPIRPHLVPLTDVLLLTLNCPQSLVQVGPIEDCDERARRLRALEIETGFDPISDLGTAFANALSGQKRCDQFLCSLCTPTFRHVVHSQVDYIHCLVPDLDKITNSSFYWGKMDRYEAERLLEGKPEGTFLLRDSAQEEYLFSVTFRKYGRSLHARIEQFNHKFSFDCHDPGVFTARTVTGLLEHYKDPSCVMFFEPMLTIPLHRNFTFSLQQLCRATIASNISYDGINELHLPNSLKSYLKEYHYKQRVRVKPFDDFYHCS